MRVFISSLIIAILVYQPLLHSAEKSKTKRKLPTPAVKKQNTDKAPEKIWLPSQFNLESAMLPEKYEGLDHKKFWMMFEEKLSLFKKAEFENTEEYLKRTENVNTLLNPISTLDRYAFRIPTRLMNFKYNADKEIYSSDTYLGYSCKPTPAKYVTCFVGKLVDNYEKYVGSNSYGVSRDVTKTSGLDFALAIDSENSIYKSLFTTNSQYDDSKILTLELPVKLEKAKELKDKNIAVIFVGNIVEAKKIDGKRVYFSATIDWPSAMDIETVAAPFNLEKIIFYVYETGEILAEYST